ncbi:cyclin-dependent kinase 9, partial [Cryptotermes secundus]|uniref:cyclin-dependent kinase 9 n=1 Tax=Cryptotermes secundus TaxID=105785 RepID=UPI000CD7B030
RCTKAGNKFVAMKKVLMQSGYEKLPIRTLREIDILHHLKHDNVVNLIEVCRSRGTQYMYETGFYLVLEFYDHDLAGLLSNGNVTITVGERKNLMLQLLHGLCYVHSNKVLGTSGMRYHFW